IPAVLKTRFGANEILTSLMLVYVAELALDYLVRGPWRDPKGVNFPQSVNFEPEATMPLIFGGGRLHIGFVIALVVALAA
ncbi:ABC transporter permease, partial [Acinetobacter baumannii]